MSDERTRRYGPHWRPRTNRPPERGVHPGVPEREVEETVKRRVRRHFDRQVPGRV